MIMQEAIQSFFIFLSFFKEARKQAGHLLTGFLIFTAEKAKLFRLRIQSPIVGADDSVGPARRKSETRKSAANS